MKSRNFLLISSILLCFIFITSCYYKDKSKIAIVNDIKVFDSYWNELKTEELYNNDVEWYLNTINKGLKPINSAAPIVKYTGFEINTEELIIIKVDCTTKKNYSITFTMDEYYPDYRGTGNSYQPTQIEHEGNKCIVTFEITDLPEENVYYEFRYAKFITSEGGLISAKLDYVGSGFNGYYGGLVAKVNSVYIPYKSILKNLNNNLSTELKLLQDVSQIIINIQNGTEKTYASSHYSNFYNKVKYPDHLPDENKGINFLACQEELYYMSHGIYYEKNYVYQIKSSDPKTKIFGVTLNNTLEEIKEALINNNYTEINLTNNQNYSIYTYESELSFIRILIYYNYRLEKVEGFSIEYTPIFNQ
jgi:hypothetical protein